MPVPALLGAAILAVPVHGMLQGLMRVHREVKEWRRKIEHQAQPETKEG